MMMLSRYVSADCLFTVFDKYLSHPTNSPKPLAISPQLFHCKLKMLLFNKSYPDLSSSPYLPPRLNSKHHSPKPSDCLPACLPDSLDLTHCLLILFWTSACE